MKSFKIKDRIFYHATLPELIIIQGVIIKIKKF
jgi:hypothetical protein